MDAVRVLTPTGTLGYGFGSEALARGMAWGPHVIAVDAGSTDPGPHYLGAGETLVSSFSIRREITDLLRAACAARIPLIIGSAGGAGAKSHVDATVEIVREVARDCGLHFRLAWLYSDVPPARVVAAIRSGEVTDFEAGFPLTEEAALSSTAIVAQMGHEPLVDALERGAEVIVAGRACDDSTIAAFPIWRGADPGLSIHMGKILECGAFSAEPFAMDVMLATVHPDNFVLEPGSEMRRASLTSVAAHTLYERENPFRQAGPGHELELSGCRFEQISPREVRVSGSRFLPTPDYHVKLEGARLAGYRSVSIAGIRCPTMVRRIDAILDDVLAKALAYFGAPGLRIEFHVYGRDGVMRSLEPVQTIGGHELGLVIDAVAPDQTTAHAAAHFVSGTLLHYHYPGQYNTAGNLAFPYSPSEINAGAVYEFSVYHLMKVKTPTELFSLRIEEI